MEPAEPSSPPRGTQLGSHLNPPPDPTNDSPDETPVEITIKFPPEQHNQTWVFTSTDTFSDLISALSVEFPSYDWTKSKALPEKTPRVGGGGGGGGKEGNRLPGPAPNPKPKPLYTPTSDSSLPLSHFHTLTLRFLAPQTDTLTTLQHQSAQAATWRAKRALARARFARLPSSSSSSSRHQTLTSQQQQQYTFHALQPLPHLPNPSQALSLLTRLSADPGIVHVMRQHRFSVGLLTEMDPAAHTSATHAGTTRTLGLNRNRGEVIELRLRTDAYDGWRDYKTIRRTLCHELTHNVHSDHDAEFWKLCRQIEREVERADWKSGGRMVGGDGVEFAPERGGDQDDEDGMVVDHGGWEGGTYVLGGGGGHEGLSAREVRARAAEARWSSLEKATREAKEHEDRGARDKE
ncbi:hypothetical protein VTK26DRAFT_9491 [Humicola hyalothermophila]